MSSAYAKNKAWIKANPARYEITRKRGKLKFHYGITLEEFNDLLRKQKRRCAICNTSKPGGRTKSLHVDHCHKTKKVRGLLCVRCNRGLGWFLDNIETLKKAVKYLRRRK